MGGFNLWIIRGEKEEGRTRGQMSLRIPKAPKEEIEPGDKKEVGTEGVGGEEKMEKGLRGICEPSQGGWDNDQGNEVIKQ